MSLDAQKYPNNTRTISGLINIVRTDDVTLLCDTSTGAVALTLQEIPLDYWSTQYKLYVVDNSNNASVNNITINAPSGFYINGSSSFIINTNKGACLLRITSNVNYIGQSTSAVGGLTQAYQTIQNEGSNLTQRNTLNFIGEGVNAVDNALNTRTDVTIPYGLGNYTCEIEISNVYAPDSGNILDVGVPVVTNTLKAIPNAQRILKYTEIGYNTNIITATPGAGNYVTTPPDCPFLTFNNVIGLATLTEDSVFLLEASIDIHPGGAIPLFWNNSDNGVFGIGIISPSRDKIVSANYYTTLALVTTDLDISTSVVIQARSGETFCVNVINMTGRNYDGVGYAPLYTDYIKFSITKLS